MSSLCGACTSLSLFPFWCLDAKGEKIVIYIYHFSSYFFQCVMNLCSTCHGRVDKNLFMWLVKH
jgi:hypothetical protein